MAGDWTEPVEVQHDMKRCVAYRARLNGDSLVVRVALEPGWHTFAMDNKERALEKLAGRQSLGIDQPTEISLSEGLEGVGSWQQTPPKDFSRAELRWYAWGFEEEAMFAVKVKRTGAGPAQIGIRGQACTQTTCKNIDVAISLPLASASASGEIDVKGLIPVRSN